MDTALWHTVEDERLRLADLLAGLDHDQWHAQSLCTEWRVRDVAAHLAMTPTQPRLPMIITGVIAARGDIWAFGRDIARDYARREVEDIVAELRRTAASRHLPPLTNPDNALLDIIVHSQDITRPLGIAYSVPETAGSAAFARAWAMGRPFRAQRRLRGLHLISTDAGIDVGSGLVVEGHLGDLLLLVTGRVAAALPNLRGPGVSRLVSA